VAQKETPMPYSKILEKETMPTVERIERAILETLS
jgi:pyruvate dehydrogenase E1 component beta subunit